MLLNKRRLGEVLAVLAANPPNSQVTIILFFIIKCYFEAYLLLDPNFMINDNHIASDDGSISTKETRMYGFFKNVNWLNLFHDLPSGIMLTVCAVYTAIMLTISLMIFYRFRFLDKSLNMDPVISRKSAFHIIIGSLLHFYDPVYVMSISFFFRTMFCTDHWTTVPNYLSYSIGSNYVVSNRNAEQLVNNRSIVINQNIACNDFQYYLLLVFTSIALLCSICLKYVQSRLLGGIPNPISPLTRNSFADHWKTLTFCMVVLLRSIFRPYISTRDFSLETMRIYWILMTLSAFSIFMVSIMTRPYYSAIVNRCSVVSDYMVFQITLAGAVIFSMPSLSKNSELTLYVILAMIGIFACFTLTKYIDRESACRPIEGDDELIRRICAALKSDKRVLGREFNNNEERLIYYGIVTSLKTYHDQEFSIVMSPYPKSIKKKPKEEVEDIELSDGKSTTPTQTKGINSNTTLAQRLQTVIDPQQNALKFAGTLNVNPENVKKASWEDTAPAPTPLIVAKSKQQAKKSLGSKASGSKFGSVPTFNLDAGMEDLGALSVQKEFRKAFRKTEKIGNESLCELYAIILRILERKSNRELLSKDQETIIHGKFTALLVVFLNYFLEREPSAIMLLQQIYIRAKKQPSQNQSAKPQKHHHAENPASIFVNTQALDSVHYCKLFHLVKLRLISRANVDILNQYGAKGIENPDNRWNMCSTLIVISEKEKVKALLKQSYTIKRRFMDEIATRGVNLTKIYEKTSKFLDCHDKLRRAFAKINRGTGGAYFPANIMEAVYLKYFLFSEIEANKKVKEAVSRNQTNDTVPLFENLQTKSNEMTIIQASLEETTFQEMTFVSTNIKRYLGYEAAELTNKKMPLIIPEPIASRHDLLVHPKLIQGHALGQDMMVKTYGRGKNGHISGLGFLMKMTPLIERGLAVTSAMLFEASNIFKEIVLILGDEGEIIELSEIASEYFEKMERIDFYSPVFGARLKEVAEMNNHILTKGKPTAEQITQERWMMTSYQAYFELGRGTAYRMKDRHNNVVYFGSNLYLMHIPRIGKTVQILKLKLLENNIIESGTLEEFKKIYKLQSAEAFCKARSMSPSEVLIFSTMSQLNLCNDEDCILDNLRTQAMLEIPHAQSKIDNSDSNIFVSKVLEEVPENSDVGGGIPKEDFGKIINKNSSLQPPPKRQPKNYFESFEKYVANQENPLKAGEDHSEISSAQEKSELSDQGQSPKRRSGVQKPNPRKSVNSANSIPKVPSGLKTPKAKVQKQPQNGNNGNNSSFHENNSSVPTTRYSITKNYFHSKAHEQLDCRQNSFKSRGLACLTGVWVVFVTLVFILFCYKQFLRFEFNVEISEKLSYPDVAVQAYHRAVVFADSFEANTLSRMRLFAGDYFQEFYGYTDITMFLTDTWPKENGTGNALELFEYHRMLRLAIDSASRKFLHPNLDLERIFVDAEIAATRDTNINRLDIKQIWSTYTLPYGQLTDWMTIFQSRFLDQPISTSTFNPTARTVSNLVQDTLRRNLYNHLSTYLSQRCLDAFQYFRNLVMYEVELEFSLMVIAILGSALVVVLSILGLALWQRSMRQMNLLVFSLKMSTFKSAQAEVVFLEDYIDQVIKSTDFHIIAKSWHANGEPGQILRLVEKELKYANGIGESKDSEKSGQTNKQDNQKSNSKDTDHVAQLDEEVKPKKDSEVNALKEALDVLKNAKKNMKKEFMTSKIERIKLVKTRTFDTKLLSFAVKLLIIILPFLAHQVADYLQDYASAVQIKSLGDLYAVMGGIWINLELARISTNLQIAFGNNYTFNGTSPSQAFETATDQLTSYYLPELQQLKRTMASDHSAMLVRLVETGHYCDLIQDNTHINFTTQCGEGSTAFLKGNAISAIKSYLSLLTSASAAASSSTRTPASMTAFLATPMFKAMYSIGYLSNFANDVFYLPLLEMVPKLDSLVKATNIIKSNCFPECNFIDMFGADEGIQNTILANTSFLVFCLVGYFCWVSKGLQRIFRIHTAMSLLLPPELIKENLLLSKFVRSQF